MERSEQIHELAAALAAAQGAMGPAVKNRTATIRSNKGGSASYEYTFADLDAVWDACRAALAANGLAVVQLPEPDPAAGEVLLRTTLIHASGQWIASTIPLIFDGSNMQSLGSAITFARRYGLATMVGITCEDDDGGQARGPVNGRHAPASTGNAGRSEPDVSRKQRDIPISEKAVGLDRTTKLAPRNGRELLAWMSRQSRRFAFNVEAAVLEWGRSHELGRRVIDWPPRAIADGHAEACRVLRSLRADAEGVPFADVASFRSWLESSGSADPARAFAARQGYPASTAHWSFAQAVACYRSLESDLVETAVHP